MAGQDQPATIFRGVCRSAKPDDAIVIEDLPPMLIASFPGPFHLARLLETATSALLEAAVINIDPPDGVPADRWHHSMARIAKKRPYLWTNHLAAIRAGYLQPGTSCAVGFPTGAGKSTTAQLKIHAALLRNLKVVFLAPTHALVDQTARDLRAAFPNTSVKGQRAGDVYLAVENHALQSAATAHHGLLLPYERDLAERLYSREDGLRILTATPTLAQGMNLPADLVIIAEDSRFDRETNRRDLLDAAALLNAAGRAGRAGQSASGIVLIVPGRVVPLSDEDGTIGAQWTQLREVFSQSDQCLVLDDPFEAVMDRVHDKVDDIGDLERYVVSRLMETPLDGEEGHSPRVDLSRSLTAFRKRKVGDEQWVASRTIAALSVMPNADQDAVALDQRYRDLASMVGLPEDVLKALSDALADVPSEMTATVGGICQWMFSWFQANPGHLFRIIKPSTFDDLFGKAYGDLPSDDEKAQYAVPKLKETLRLWMDGAPLNEIQTSISPKGAAAEFSPDARKFVIRMIPDLAHVMGLPSRIMQMFTQGGSEPNTLEGAGPLLLAHVCVRRGLRDAEMAAFSMLGGALPRRAVHRAFEEIRLYVAEAESRETIEGLKERVRAARDLKEAIEAFSGIDSGPFDATQM